MLSQSLSTESWRFRDASQNRWLPARVPGCVHTDLLAAKKIPDPFWGKNEGELQWIEERDWEYRVSFKVGSELAEQERIELVADGLDTVATVTLNGREVARTENMFVGHRWDVASLLRPGRNELSVRFDSALKYIRSHRLEHAPREFNDPVGRCTVIRKQQCQFGWDWGPRFVTAGIWRDVRLEAGPIARLQNVQVRQIHTTEGTVRLELAPELTVPEEGVTLHWSVFLGDERVTQGSGREIELPDARLWWPNGHGAQPLYDLRVEARGAEGASLGHWSRRLGLRTIQLDRHEDERGETFQFVVNGRPVFAKGANWIPAHCFVAGLKRADYERDLRAAARANMNMIRVWGGGVYESEDFYDLCDELGLLVWQDFMFSCTLYPADEPFLKSVREEATYQVKRLRHRACLALWCGNNEVFSCNARELSDPANAGLYESYERLFHRTLPEVVSAHDPVTAYWPSSPWRGNQDADHLAGERRGDTHYWDVWHGRFPVKDYERWSFRFVSEFGMQSYSSEETQATFCPPDDGNVFGAAMENHQKNRGGNQVVLDYVSRRYRFPEGQRALIYLSQLNQAHCMQVGTEQYRRLMPHCMGAIYWQLNDCWPVASWSSIEFTGRWKALHYVAKRFFAPAIVTAHVPGDETAGIGNYRQSTLRDVHLYTVSELQEPTRAALRWDIFHVDGRRISGGVKRVVLRYGESVKQHTIDLDKAVAKFDRDHLLVRMALEIGARRVSEDTVFLTAPRFVALPKAKTRVSVRAVGPQEVDLTFTSNGFQHRFWFDLPGVVFEADDNFFELYPGEPRTVRVRMKRPLTRMALLKKLRWMSLVDSY